MSTAREAPNPLRPYYIPPSIGVPPELGNSSSTASRQPSTRNATSTTYVSSARDIFADIDYSGYVTDGSRSTLESVRAQLDQALYKYMSVLLAQPFEVAKTILQVRSQAEGDGTIPLVDAEDDEGHSRGSAFTDYSSDNSDDDDEPAYFTSSATTSASYSPSRSRRRNITDRAGYVLPSTDGAPHQLSLKRTDSILEVLSQLWTKEGAWGVWKGANATFLYSILSSTLESWSRSFLAAIVNVPDPGMIAGLGMPADVIDSPYPWLSLGVAVAAAAISGILLAPLDIVRTKLILTSTTTSKKRGLWSDFTRLPSYLCPSSILLPTLLQKIIDPLITHGAPLLLRSRFGIDQVVTPTSFSVAAFLSSTVELFISLPVETVLRRGQIAVLTSPNRLRDTKPLDLIVDPGGYRGLIGTMWLIVREEGGSTSPQKKPVPGAKAQNKTLGQRRGQGVEGLWRGWRVGMWGLVGIWGAAAMSVSNSASAGEF